jgi:hypothetical protein
MYIERKMKLHPDIVAFWEQKDLTVKPRFPRVEKYKFMYWDAVRDKIIHYTIAQTHDTGETTYWINGQAYSEKEMLKIIKLKALL